MGGAEWSAVLRACALSQLCALRAITVLPDCVLRCTRWCCCAAQPVLTAPAAAQSSVATVSPRCGCGCD